MLTIIGSLKTIKEVIECVLRECSETEEIIYAPNNGSQCSDFIKNNFKEIKIAAEKNKIKMFIDEDGDIDFQKSQFSKKD